MFKNKNESNIVYKCTVRLIEDADILECEFQPFHRGSYLTDFICQQLKIKEKDYFGLRYVDMSKQRHWLDLGKSIIKQCKDVDPILFSFRVKFYPADPFRLTGNARVMLYQQLKRDLRHGRLYCSIGEAAALSALIVQEELGDFNEDVHLENYISSLNLALRQTETLEKKVMELHGKRQPFQDSSVAMDEFMDIARGLETYGIDPHPVKDHKNSQLYIGINYSGISTFIAGKRSQHFRWNEVHKINFEGKMFIAHLSYTDASREPIYQELVKAGLGIKPEYRKIDDLPMNKEMKISSFQWKETIYGSKVIVNLEDNTWFHLPQRMTKAISSHDPYLTNVNEKEWNITFKGRVKPNGSAIFDLKYE